MPKTRSPSVLGSGRILYLPTARNRPKPMQPRNHFDTGGLKELAAAGQRRAEQQEEGDEMERTYFHGR